MYCKFMYCNFLQDEFRAVFPSNFFPLPLGCCSLDFWLILALKLTIWLIGGIDMVGIMLDRGLEKCWKINNIIDAFNEMKKRMLLIFKMFYYVLFYNFLLDLHNFCWLNKVFLSNQFEFMFESLHGIRKYRYFYIHISYITCFTNWFHTFCANKERKACRKGVQGAEIRHA